MPHFWKAIRVSLRYKWSIVGAILSSLTIAMLWGASITTIYPFVRIVFRGETVHTWIEEELTKAESNLAKVKEEIEERKEQGLDNRTRIDRLRAEEKAIQWFRSVQPMVKQYAPATPFGTLLLAMGLLLTATVLKGICLVVGVVLVSRIAHRTVLDMRRDFYGRALLMDQKRIDQMGTSNLMTLLTHNMNVVSGGLSAFYGKSIREPLKMLACLAAAAFISWKLLILSLFVVPFGAWAIHSISKRMRRATTNEMGGITAVFQTLIETFGAIKTVRIYNQEDGEKKRFDADSAQLYRMGMRISFFDALLRPITEILGIFVVVIAILAGAYLVLNQQTHLFGIRISPRPLDPELLMVFFAMLAGTADPARKMSEIYYLLIRGGTACEKLYEIFELENKVKAPANPAPVPLHSKEIQFQGVLFRYQKRRRVLHQFNLTIPYQQNLAICGGNGSGKSTIVNLICRFYDPNRGAILMDGQDISQVDPMELRKQIAWVTQDAVLFRGTIRDNILYSKPDATDAEIERVLKLVAVDEFIRQLPAGLDTEVGDDGKMLSGGQRQKIGLARAMICDPRIMILDEPTSQMDAHSRRQVNLNLIEFLRDRTAILITHDPDALCLADRIIFLRQGKIYRDWEASEPKTDSRVVQRLLARAA